MKFFTLLSGIETRSSVSQTLRCLRQCLHRPTLGSVEEYGRLDGYLCPLTTAARELPVASNLEIDHQVAALSLLALL